MRVRTKRNRRRKRTIKLKGGKGEPTFHILITTMGRASLSDMLDSLRPQLKENDAVTIVFDGKDARAKLDMSDEYMKKMKCKVNIIEQEPRLGHYGHHLINKYAPTLSPETTYIMFGDDDDLYTEGAFDILRKKCRDPSKLYISRLRNDQNFIPENRIVPNPGMKEIKENFISKQNGIIPYRHRASAKMGVNSYTGDYEFYKELGAKAPVEFIEDVIYKMVPAANSK